MNSLIKEIVKFNCRALKIEKPKIEVVNSDKMPTKTTLSTASSGGGVLLINEIVKTVSPEWRLWLILSHECRHLWQSTKEEFKQSFSNYLTSAETDLFSYNNQPAEIDANAWAMVVVKNVFNINVSFEKDLGKELQQKIFDRAVEIINGPF